ncbi:carbohydrate sulfotransferase 14-like isoform X1 [Orbicella faveolata]|uniref:carbohydrate sulfotransferase 14-like isoform X1 n=1 Tax=Orbicella faveolata TaxID=48498 RepID=UPI0009E443AE|nr:carbohydrate sulfotransferase 14-like isoform X1 [Orbicella faveolata]
MTAKKLFFLLAVLTTGILLIVGLYEKQMKMNLNTVPSQDERAIKEGSNVRIIQDSFNFSTPRELRQQERRKLVKTYCQKTGHNIGMKRPSHIEVIPSLKILYCITPKVASRQWRSMLYPFNEGRRIIKLGQFPPDQQKQMLETYFKFTFVREPFERILSAYKDKFVHLRQGDRRTLEFHGREILKNFRPNASKSALEKLDDITFREFIEYLVTKGSNKSTRVMDWHWNNYANICGMCAINYDFIGHYETFDQDLADFKEAAGLSPEEAKRFNARASNKSDTASSLLNYYSQIPVEWIDILGQLYRASFEMFNYDFPGPLESLFE